MSLNQKTEDIASQHADIYELARQDMDFFAGLALPLVTEYAYPEVFQAIWHLLIDYAEKTRDFSKIAVGIPRGFAKTSVIKLLILYCIIYTNKRFFLVLGSTAGHAQNIIADIADMLDEPNIKNTFGDWRSGVESDNKEVKKFGFRGKNVILAALGQGGSVRGLNIKNSRPDLMLFDDIQTKEDAESDTVSAAIYTWMLGTAMKAGSHSGCLYVFLGNMYPTKNSILRKLKNNPEWIKFIVGGIKADGTSLWEELKPLKQLLAEARNDYASGHPEIFHSEVLNDENANVNTNIDINKIPAYPFTDDEFCAGYFIIIDPSNDKINSDAVTISLNGIINGKPVVTVIDEGRYSPEETIKRSIALAAKSGASLICVEANAYQYSLLYWFNKYIESLSMYELQVKPIYSGSRSKNSRILDMFKALVSGEIIVHPNCWAIVMNQIVQFNPLKTTNVDGILDCITYIPKVLTEYEHLISINNPLGRLGITEVSEVIDVSQNCSF
jgi:hypothetical protein